MSIPELGDLGTAGDTLPNNNSMYDDDDDANVIEHGDVSEFLKPPIRTWTWTDHERQCTIVDVAILIFTGAVDVNFEISNDGHKIYINYVWPPAIYQPLELFGEQIAAGEITPNHPMVHSLQTQNLATGITEKSKPKGRIGVKLPIRVQRESNTWTKRPIAKNDGTRIALLEFKGFQENIHIKEADTYLRF